jgi:hypothetical protein
VKICVEVVRKIEEVFEETIEKWIEKVDKVCEDLPWPLDFFCHVVTSVVKVIETVVKTIIKTVVTVYCYPLALVLTLAAEVVQLVELIPVIGSAVKWWIGALVWVWSQFIGLFDAAIGLIGLRPIKHIRLEVIILMREDRSLTVPPDRVNLVVQRTEAIYRARADIKVHTTIHQVNTPSPRGALFIEDDIPLLGILSEDTTEAGVYFQTTITEMLWEDNPWFVIRVGAPIVVFVVDDVSGADHVGCSAGPLVDYICVEGGVMLVSPQTTPVTAPIMPEPAGSTIASASEVLAHEMGHACGLLHDNVADEQNGDPTNLMYFSSPRGDNLSPFQRAIVRSSPHVTYI